MEIQWWRVWLVLGTVGFMVALVSLMFEFLKTQNSLGLLAACVVATIGAQACWTVWRRLWSVVALVSVMWSTGCAVIGPGHVGVRVNTWGSDTGIEAHPMPTGRHWYNPVTEDIYSFPTFVQRFVYEEEEAITVRSAEGMSLTADVAIAFRLETDRVPSIFGEFRQDLQSLERGYVRDRTREALERVASQMKITDILGPRIGELMANARTEVNQRTQPRGIVFDDLAIVGKPRVDDRVEQTINGVIQAMQAANAAEQKVRTAKAEADQAIEQSRGQAESMLAVAKAQAEANRIIAESLRQYGESVLLAKAIDKWDGRYPQVVSGSGAPVLIQTTPTSR